MARPARFRGPEYWRRFIPPGAKTVDWDNPLCQELRVLSHLTGPRSIDLVTDGESTTFNGDPSSGTTPFGQASIFTGTQGQQFAHTVSDSQFSGAALIQSAASGINQTIIDHDDGGSGRIFQFRINTSNLVEYIAFNSVPTAFSATISLPDFQNGAPVGFSAGGTTVRLLAGETATETTIGGTQATLTGTQNPCVGYRLGTASAFTGGISLYALWGRMLSLEEWLEWSRYPGQLFKPLARRAISFPTVAGVDAPVAGAASASAAGAPSIRVDLSAALAGVSTAGSAGTAGTSVTSAVTLVGATLEGSAGTASVRLDPFALLTGASTAGSAGTAAAEAADTTLASIAGTASTSAAGTLSIRVDLSVALAGVSATGLGGSATPSYDTFPGLAGASMAGAAGAASPSTGVDALLPFGTVAVAGHFAPSLRATGRFAQTINITGRF